MKNLTLSKLSLLSLILTLTFTACQEDSIIEENPSTDNFNNNLSEKSLTTEEAKSIMEKSLKNTSQELTANLFDMAVQMSKSLQAENSPEYNSANEDVEFDFTCDSLVNFNLVDHAYVDGTGQIESEFKSDLSYRINCVTDTLFYIPGFPPLTLTYPASGDLFVDTEASSTRPSLESEYTSNLHCNLSDIMNIFDIVDKEPISIDGVYSGNGELRYDREEKSTLVINDVTNVNLTSLTFNTWTREIEAGTGTFNYVIHNGTESLAFEGTMEVSDINELAFYSDGELLFVLPLGDIIDQIFA